MANVLMAAAGLWSQWIGPILQLVIGLGLVVFVHELGHFLAAKRVGIKVERFALGFGPRLFGAKVGETDYCVSLLPLGGYIKMLGQEDFGPTKEREELDPRSFEAKSVGRRFAVIAAGVVMNVIFAAVLFIVVGLVGMDFAAPVVGGVMPGYPASEVVFSWRLEGPASAPATGPDAASILPPDAKPGLLPGDVVLELDGKKMERFPDLMMRSVLSSDRNAKHRIVVRRGDQAGRSWIGTGEVAVKTDPGGRLLVFGIQPASTTTFAQEEDAISDWPFHDGDRLLAVAGCGIQHPWQVADVDETLDGRPVAVTFLREGRERTIEVQPLVRTRPDVVWLTDGTRGRMVWSRTDDKGNAVCRVVLPGGEEKELPADELAGGGIREQLDILGMIPRQEVHSVQTGSAAAKAGILPGDVIVGYGDHGAPTHQEMLDISRKVEGKATDIIVLRDGRKVTLSVKPGPAKDSDLGEGQAKIGIYYASDLAHAVVAGLRPNSPADKAGVAPGDLIEKVNDRSVASWVDVLAALREAPAGAVTVSLTRGARQLTVQVPSVDQTVFSAGEYQIESLAWAVFQPLTVTIHKPNPVDAVVWGAGETWNYMVRTYATLRALIQRTVSTEALSGPAGLAIIAVRVGRDQPLIGFVYFMAFISVTIAVLNFLPLPVVDGGHAVFLLIEKVRGRPLPVKVMNVTQFIGLALLALVFILLTWQDIARALS